LLPVSVREMRRCLGQWVFQIKQSFEHFVHWQQWRRMHGSIAQYYHYKRRAVRLSDDLQL
ncbi:hypothetical protein H6F89_31580, partial [Cyanobacteria bacterium FACHB-63]|nr:hypothetical protein [Cyanobacteria bacterium FACHB-63]